jgi:hypothetical protein
LLVSKLFTPVAPFRPYLERRPPAIRAHRTAGGLSAFSCPGFTVQLCERTIMAKAAFQVERILKLADIPVFGKKKIRHSLIAENGPSAVIANHAGERRPMSMSGIQPTTG